MARRGEGLKGVDKASARQPALEVRITRPSAVVKRTAFLLPPRAMVPWKPADQGV